MTFVRTIVAPFTLLASLTGFAATHAHAENAAFAACIADLKTQALAQNVSAGTVNDVLSRATYIDRVVDSDRAQPEFNKTFTTYYQQRVTSKRIEAGRKLLVTHRALLDRLQQQTGVPPHYLLALWGLETNFGNYFGKLPIPSALATLACDSRRTQFFSGELLAILKIIDAGDLNADELRGSWAGAIGHMQFMPTTYLAYAVDGDGDGRRDLFGSVSDALTSGGHYLRELGWQKGFRWGREVKLPAGFDYATTGIEQRQPLSAWAERGVTDAFGNRLPSLPLESAIVLPTGATGPAFIIYENFHILMQWNRSQSYALAVGLLADRINGAGRLQQPLPSVQSIQVSRAQALELQRSLNELGFESGKPDGVVGPATTRAIRNFQASRGVVADGYPSQATLQLLEQMPK